MKIRDLFLGVVVCFWSCSSGDEDSAGGGTTGGPDAKSCVTILSWQVDLPTADLASIAQVIRSEKADVVALQGIDYRTIRCGGKDRVTELAYRTFKVGIFGGSVFENGGEKGVGILSGNLFDGTEKVRLTKEVALLECKYTLPSQKQISIATVYFTGAEAKMKAQAEALCDYYARQTVPALILASVPEEPGSAVIDRLDETFLRLCRGRDVKTYPADVARQQYDYVLVPRNQNWQLVEVRTIGRAQLSSHKAMYVKVGLLK